MNPRLTNSRMFLIQYTTDVDLPQGLVCGRVEHIQSGASQRFASQEEFEEFVCRILREESQESELSNGSEPGCHTPD
jgi:hypothetical protein